MSLNQKAWTTLFERYQILEAIEDKGFYEISAKAIKEEREPRLMAKFDHFKNLPEVFRQHQLSILPLSRSSYIIGDFQVYKDLQYEKDAALKEVYLPASIRSLDPKQLYSESAALHCAYATGMIDQLLSERAVPTVSGRMSSSQFQFRIQTRRGAEREIAIKKRSSRNRCRL